jgi:hypothetical protein
MMTRRSYAATCWLCSGLTTAVCAWMGCSVWALMIGTISASALVFLVTRDGKQLPR